MSETERDIKLKIADGIYLPINKELALNLKRFRFTKER